MKGNDDQMRMRDTITVHDQPNTLRFQPLSQISRESLGMGDDMAR